MLVSCLFIVYNFDLLKNNLCVIKNNACISINNLQFGKNLIVFNFIFNINTNILFISFNLLI